MDEFLEAVFGRIVGTFYKGDAMQEDEAGNAKAQKMWQEIIQEQ